MDNNKEITIEDLAIMVQNGFEETAKKSDIERLDNRMGKMETQMSDMGNKLNQIDKRMFSLEEDFSELKLKEQKQLTERVEFIERKLGIA